jgi:hypothetical protein
MPKIMSIRMESRTIWREVLESVSADYGPLVDKDLR